MRDHRLVTVLAELGWAAWYTSTMRTGIVAVVILAAVGVLGCRGEPGAEAGAASERAASPASDAKARPKDDGATPSAGEPREGSGGLARRVREIAKDAKDAKANDPVLPAGEGVAIPAVIPPGEILIEHGCSHSMEPFGTGYWSSTTTVDLVAATIRSSRIEGDTGEPVAPTATRTEKRTENSSTLAPADVARIRTALDQVLAGGPYAPVYALSEGIVCTLSLRIGSDPPFFRIDKSREGSEDSVTRLIASLGVAAPP